MLSEKFFRLGDTDESVRAPKNATGVSLYDQQMSIITGSGQEVKSSKSKESTKALDS
jgi:hypothetical protein